MKRSCQRHPQVFDLPVRRMISLVPTPSALNRTISARQTCLCGVLRFRVSTFRRRRSAGLRVMEIPVRMRQTRMRPVRWESPPGFKCQTRSTSKRILLKNSAYVFVNIIESKQDRRNEKSNLHQTLDQLRKIAKARGERTKQQPDPESFER